MDTYHRLTPVWWVVRLARALHEVPRGLDPRLARRPSTWAADTAAPLAVYHRPDSRNRGPPP